MIWKSVCCEVQGRGHIKTGTPCQDKTTSLVRNEIHVIALADGAGSAQLSHFGAECIVQQISTYLADHFEELFANEDGKRVKQELLDMLKTALADTALELECEVKDLASTLLAVAVWDDRYIIAHIGDGVIGYLKDNDLKVASVPDNGEFSNVTTFVTSGEALTSMRLFKGKLSGISAFVLMSDGTEQSLYHKATKTLGSAVVRLMQRTCLIDSDVMYDQLKKTMLSVISQNTQDDCSIAILARPIGVLQPLEALSFVNRCELFQIDQTDRCAKQRVKRYDRIISQLMIPQSLQQVSRKIHLNPKYTKRHLNKLLNAGIIKKKGQRYFCV